MKILLLFVSLFVTGVSFGQAKEGSVEYNKKQQPAAVIELGASEDVVSRLLGEHLAKKGKKKAAEVKGFAVYRNTGILSNDSTHADLFFYTERKSRREKEITLLSLLLTTQQDGSAAGNKVRFLSMEEAKIYLDELMPAVDAYNLELEIKTQTEAVAKAESKYKSLLSDGEDLERKRVGIEKKIAENKQEQQLQTGVIEVQKQKLAEALNKRKS
ncbi:MAG: hypothetical protein JWP69_204 [Flaviaesturariibacter sp.]|nr:hypothetical protein [Flaviaesturariibacter sp.]